MSAAMLCILGNVYPWEDPIYQGISHAGWQACMRAPWGTCNGVTNVLACDQQVFTWVSL